MLKYGKRGAPTKFTDIEDKKLIELVKKYGTKNWILISKKLYNKSARQCHARWMNYVNPSLKHGDWTEEEDELLITKFEEIGPKWTSLAHFFKGRPANDVRYRLLRLNRSRCKSKKLNLSNDGEEEDFPEEEETLIDKIFGYQCKEVVILGADVERFYTVESDFKNHMI